MIDSIKATLSASLVPIHWLITWLSNARMILFNRIIANLEGTHDLAAAQAAWDRLHRLNPNYPGLEQLKQGLENAQK